jgi:hypothetical protein
LKEIVAKAFSTENEFGQAISEDSNKLSMYNAKNALKEFGVVQLSVEQARDTLSLRADFIE